jgi:hypothetical protein
MQNASAPLQHFFVVSFAIRLPGGKIITEVIEVPHTGKPQQDKDAAWAAIKVRYPNLAKTEIRKTAARIESRPGGTTPTIPVREGETVRQLFPDDTEYESARTVGTVVFDGARCDVILRHIRSKSMFALTLRQSGGIVVNFSEQVTVMRLANELPKLIAEMLGVAGTQLKLFFVFTK